MRIYFALASVGGWNIMELEERESSVLVSFIYDRKNLKLFVENKQDDCISTDMVRRS